VTAVTGVTGKDGYDGQISEQRTPLPIQPSLPSQPPPDRFHASRKRFEMGLEKRSACVFEVQGVGPSGCST
jgi:hypothetical protein